MYASRHVLFEYVHAPGPLYQLELKSQIPNNAQPYTMWRCIWEGSATESTHQKTPNEECALDMRCQRTTSEGRAPGMRASGDDHQVKRPRDNALEEAQGSEVSEHRALA